MLGSIIGDLAGSIYEFDQYQKASPVQIKEILPENAFYSDDTILTVAICDAILTGGGYGDKLKSYGKKYLDAIPKNVEYFEKMFSPNFAKWLYGNETGTSNGNGAMMRISPVGFLFDSEEEVIENARLATIPSHNSPEAIDSAKTIALIIYYARKGLSKDEIIEKLKLTIKKPTINKFNYTCLATIDLCLYSLFTSNSFEESIIKAISFGGDTDTNACIVGGMAEAMFGIDKKLKEEALKKLPDEFINVLNRCEIYK